MRQEQSQGKRARSGRSSGTLFIVGVPIGHPDDLTIRALVTFRKVGLVATKCPRATQALLAHHGIHTTFTTYDRVNAAEKVPILLSRLKQGAHIALVSDCGMPAVYDPGRLLIKAASTAHVPLEVIPGTSAIVTAAAVAGLDGNAFVFEGRWSGGRREFTRRLRSLESESRTIILFPPAQALRHILTLLSSILGNRRVVLAADLTRKTQRIVRGRVQEVLRNYPFQSASMQVTLVVEGRRNAGRKTRRVT
ncbi:MAG: SAM-dependent methyltransferase [Nitrospirota bacterium]|nr:SAM-dependent methyltransferase [Nitrospirota bacterium]